MTTSDDEPRFAERDDDDLAETTHAEPLDGLDDEDGLDDDLLGAPEPPAARWPLAILAGLGIGLVGVAVWAVVYSQLEREYVGVAVVIGLAVGWAVRVVSRRTTIVARIVSVLITALASVAGMVVGLVAYTAQEYRSDFWTLLNDVIPDTANVVTEGRPVLTYGILAAALVLAWLAAGPQKESTPRKKKGAEPVTYADDETIDEAYDDSLPPTTPAKDAADDE